MTRFLLTIGAITFAAATAAGQPAGDEDRAQPSTSSDQRPDDDAPDFEKPASEGGTVVPKEGSALPGVTPTDRLIPGGVPPSPIQDWFIEGELVDSASVVRSFIAPVLDGANWSEALRDDRLKPVLDRIGYHGEARIRRMSGGIRVILSLTPVTKVRHVVVDIRAGLGERLREPIFANQIQRRMTLRPGNSLLQRREDRRRQLNKERDRLALFLRNDGFFDAKIRIKERPSGRYGARLDVIVTPGSPYTVGRINVVGNTEIRAGAIVDKFRHGNYCPPLIKLCLSRARFTRTRLSRDIQAVAELYQKRGYPGVRVRTDFDPKYSFKRRTKTVEFTVDVRERRKIDVRFAGNDPRKFPPRKLRKLLTLAAEGSYDDVAVQESADSIRQYYQSKGYFEANVAWVRTRRGIYESLAFNITQGPKLNVRRVRFTGNRSISTGVLRKEIRTQPFRRIIIGESGGYATTLQLAQDVRRIRRLYADRGFAEVSIDLAVRRTKRARENAAALAAGVASNQDADGLWIEFVIEEGRARIVEEVVVDYEDKRTISAEKLLRNTSLRAGRAFRDQQAGEDAKVIKRYYEQNGFPRAKIETTTELGSRTGYVLVRHKVLENTPARVGKIIVRGNFKTRKWVIVEESGLEEGADLTLEARERAQANLGRSGLFAAVNIDYVGREDNAQEIVNVVINVQERRDVLAEFEFGGGWSTDTKLFAEAGVTIPNLGGIGIDTKFRAQAGQEILSFNGTLTLPRWIMRRAIGSSFSWDLSGFWRKEFTERFGDLETYGGSIAATKQGTRGFFDGWLFALRYDYRQRDRDEELVRPSGPSDDITNSPVSTTTSSIGPVLIIDKRKDIQGRRNPLGAAKGFRVELRASYAEDFALGTNRFIKVGGSGQHFWSFGERVFSGSGTDRVQYGRRFRLANSVRFDQGVLWGGNVLLPEVERFFAGGDTTVRGFEEDRLATEVIEQTLTGGIQTLRVLPAGGNIRLIYNLDLQIAAWDKMFLLPLPVASAIFYDTGIVTNSLDGFKLGDLRHSIGVALARLVTPFGSFSLEYAIPLDPGVADNQQGRVHVNLGLLF